MTEISKKVYEYEKLKSEISSRVDSPMYEVSIEDVIKMLRELADVYEAELNLGLNKK